MSKTSGTSDEILNLPSGGGSVAGSGSSFSVDLNTGTATASFNLMLPAGPNGIVPPLTLQYSAGAGQGPFGLGWSFGFLTIRRKLTVLADPPDLTAVGAYSLVGVGDLVDMGSGRFRPTVDSTGQLIQFTGGVWTITDKLDTVSSLGSTAASQLGGTNPCAWLLDHCTDSSGNAVVYTWLEDGGSLLPQTITWGTCQIVFQYQARPDLIVDGTYGQPITTDKRCSVIELHVTTEKQSLVRSWTLLYEDSGGRGRSLLATIREQGHAADGTVLAAPDRTFAYSSFGTPAMLSVSGWTTSLLDSNMDLVDLNGDGLPDVLQLGNGLPIASMNLGQARFGPPTPVASAPAALQLSSANVAFADMSGEGNADLLVLNQPLSGYYPLSAPSGAAPAFGMPVFFPQAPDITLSDPRVRLLDLNGDGITDILFDSGRGWLLYLREPNNTWSTYPRLLPANLTPPVSLTDPHIYLGDMTGDGLTDIVRVMGGSVTYWPGRADGGWNVAINMSPELPFSLTYDPTRLNVVDVDGDGCADLLYVDANSITVWLNTGAGQLADPIVIPATPPAYAGSYRVVDLLGAGTLGVLFQLPNVRAGVSRQAFLDISGGVKPYLLTDLTNGPALSTHVAYRTSTAFALDDAAAGSPWQTNHPFPLQCVWSSDVTDHGTGALAATRYAYHNGRYDPSTRTFLGFGKVDCDQVGDATCPTQRVETVFHLGLDPNNLNRPLFGTEAFQLGALRRKPLSTTVYGMDGSALQAIPYSVTLHTYDTLLIPSGLGDGNQVAVPYITLATEQRRERQATMLSTRQIQYLKVDNEGNVTSQRTWAQRTGVATPDQDITTTTTFAAGGTNLQIPARVTQTAADGSIVSVNITYYDGDAYEGLAEGQATQGLVSRMESRAFDDTFAASIWGTNVPDLTTFGYHRLPGDATGWWITHRAHQRSTGPQGPILSTRNALGGVQTLQLDSAGQRVIAVTDPVGNTMTAAIDPRVWQTTSLTDANGHTSTDQFDALGRVIATVGPLDSPSSPSTTYVYSAGAISQVLAKALVTYGGADSVPTTTWVDGSGHVLGMASPGSVAGQYIVSKASSFGARGLASVAFLPFTTSSDTAWQAPPAGTGGVAYVYDALGRVTQTTRPDGLVIATRHDGDTVITSETWPRAAALDIEQQVYDAAGQMISVSRNAGDHWVEQTYSYDARGKIASVTLPGGAQVIFASDLLGRCFSHQSPDMGRTIYMIDACGHQRSRQNSVGQIVATTFDAADRMQAVYHDAETTPRVKYDYLDTGGATPADGITANRYGRLWRITDEVGTVTYQYDEMGRTVSTQRTDAISSAVFVNQVSYDALGRTVTATLPAVAAGVTPRTVQYTYGADGRVATASGIVNQAVYDVYGRLTSIVYANKASTLIDYRPNAGGIARVRISDSAGTLLRDTPVAWNNGVLNGLSSNVAAEDSVAYSYDSLRRLSAANYAQAATAADAHAWAFDDSFNLTSSSDSGALTYKAGTHQLASAGGQSIVFDAAGRVTSGRFGTAIFDGADRLTGLTSPAAGTLAHTYDCGGRRSRTLTAGAQTYFSPVGNVEIQSGTAVTWLAFGGQRVAADVGGALWFFHSNALGGKDLITDATGLLASRIVQTPFGLQRPAGGAASTPAGTTTVLALLITGSDGRGLMCQGHRWYDPQNAQFISPDPVVTGAYIVGVWNPYLYCLGNPITLYDPTGCSFLSILEAIGVAIVAAVCVVAAVFTCGVTILGMTVTFAYLDMMEGVAVGSLGGALVGTLAAQKAGGNIWAGAFVGALLGATTSLIGGNLGGLAAAAVDCGNGNSLQSFIVSGVIQGTTAGMGTGLASGFAGGKGSVDSALQALAQGAAYGAFLGALLSLGVGSVVGTGIHGLSAPDRYLNPLDLYSKFMDSSSASTIANSVDNQLGVMASGQQLVAPGGVTPGNIGGAIIPNLLTTSPTQFTLFGHAIGIPLSGVAGAMIYNAGFAAAVDISMVADHLGMSYAWQLVLMIGAAPYFIDLAFAEFQIFGTTIFDKGETGFNIGFGSSNPNNID